MIFHHLSLRFNLSLSILILRYNPKETRVREVGNLIKLDELNNPIRSSDSRKLKIRWKALKSFRTSLASIKAASHRELLRRSHQVLFLKTHSEQMQEVFATSIALVTLLQAQLTRLALRNRSCVIDIALNLWRNWKFNQLGWYYYSLRSSAIRKNCVESFGILRGVSRWVDNAMLWTTE